MEVPEIRLFKEPARSFIVYHEKKPFSPWHHHPEYELVLITKGRGRRMVGDHADRFEDNDLVLLGPDLPHEWLCDQEYFVAPDGFNGEGIVIQFTYSFLGERFFDLYENSALKKILMNSSRGIELPGAGKEQIIALMHQMLKMDATGQLYALFSIFKILMSMKEMKVLSSPVFLESTNIKNNEPMKKALQFIMQNFQRQIQVKDLLELTHMSNTAFCNAFKYSYRMPFKTYLLNLRIGYACRLLMDGEKNIAEIAFESGFENMSNFNRQFKKVKGCTPKEYRQNRCEVPE